MIIQWFPGHMTKALRMMEQEIKLVDLAIYVLDSRAPFSCLNPQFTRVVGEKPILYVLNKSDMADAEATKKWLKYFRAKDNSEAISLDSTHNNISKTIEPIIRKMLDAKITKYKSKGVTTVLRAMVLGVPNSGKSTLINSLVGKYKAITGNRPGVTKGKQWVKMATGIELLDTPGTLWPSFEAPTTAKNLAYIGSIKDEVLDISGLALEFIKDVLVVDPEVLAERYGVACNAEPIAIMEAIAKARGFVQRGGECDYERTSRAILDDFRKGRMGRITLEKP